GADTHGLGGGGNAFARVELGIELGETFAIGPALERIGPLRNGAALEAAQPLQPVPRPADRLAELPLADHLDPDLGLLTHDPGDRILEAGVVRSLVERLSALLGAQEVL